MIFFSHEGSHKLLLSARFGFLSGADAHKAFDKRSARIFVRGEPRTGDTPRGGLQRVGVLPAQGTCASSFLSSAVFFVSFLARFLYLCIFRVFLVGIRWYCLASLARFVSVHAFLVYAAALSLNTLAVGRREGSVVRLSQLSTCVLGVLRLGNLFSSVSLRRVFLFGTLGFCPRASNFLLCFPSLIGRRPKNRSFPTFGRGRSSPQTGGTSGQTHGRHPKNWVTEFGPSGPVVTKDADPRTGTGHRPKERRRFFRYPFGGRRRSLRRTTTSPRRFFVGFLATSLKDLSLGSSRQTDSSGEICL